MYCYAHEGIQAVGICKTCGKGVCKGCALDIEFAVCCSGPCEIEARQLNEMNQRGKKLYGIGTSDNCSSSQATIYFVLGLAFAVSGVIFFPKMLVLTYFLGGMGVLMILLGFFIRQRMKNLGIQM